MWSPVIAIGAVFDHAPLRVHGDDVARGPDGSRRSRPRRSAGSTKNRSYKKDASKALGNRSFMRSVSLLPRGFTSSDFDIAAKFPQDLAARAAGRASTFQSSAATAMRRNWRAPSEIALNTATRSAQTVSP